MMAIKDCWFFNGDRAREVFGFVKKTEAGELMDEISDIFQPAADDIRGWKTLKDVGKFSDNTMLEFYEAWALVPVSTKTQILKIMKKLAEYVTPETLTSIIGVYLTGVSLTK